MPVHDELVDARPDLGFFLDRILMGIDWLALVGEREGIDPLSDER
ncbi:hypothetical protein SAMN06296378_0351 [Salinibacterium xinjiangense]|uniref:Uncharacterized protein n=1 Tax=Salinibacterium xinjiangense TaxID=386302 RepID=A0A2C8YIC8_9MICO|nr:hypothetical protein [Salinibacterium xinjiangense]SOE50127.1 hypothetical protein SAMN06296378_0351 [Salinibacterium xinjiangense]